jgi:hypothetical protein
MLMFDFLEQYQNYSTIELLKIVERPDDYQPLAVDAAAQILKERMITEEDKSAVEKYYLEIDKKEKEQKEKLKAYKDSVTDLVEPIVYPKETVEPRKFVRILLLLIALQYAWWFFNQTKRLIRIFKHGVPPFEFLFYFQFINVLYVPIIFLLVYKRKKWGWILLFADSLFTLVLLLSEVSFVIEGYFKSLWYFYVIFIRLLFLLVLWRPMIAEHFKVTLHTKRNTFFLVIAIALAFLGIVYFIYG